MCIEKTEEYRIWIDGLNDLAGRARVLMRVDRLIHGNPGVDTKPDQGRVGGDKSTQTKDIALAMELNRIYLE